MLNYKNFQDILLERQQQKTNLLDLQKQINELSIVSEKNTNLVKDFKTQNLSKDLKEIPELNVELLLHNDSISSESRSALALIKDELVHGYHVMPRRRTDCEKRISVLQDNRFTTHGSKFFQANLEQQVHQQNLVNLTLEIEETNIELEKLMYEYKKIEAKIENILNSQKKCFENQPLKENTQKEDDLFVIDKNTDNLFLNKKELQLLSIKIRRKLSQLKEQKMNAENTALELLEWSKIKEEEFAAALINNEAFDPNDANYGQFIHLAKRFFQNYLNTHTTNADATTSDVLNIDGLCLTALNIGIKNNLLGKMFEGFSQDHIRFILKGIYGVDVEFFVNKNGTTEFKFLQK